VDIYPNPAYTSIHYRFMSETSGAVEIRIVDVTGRLVHYESAGISRGLNVLNSDIDGLAAGVYQVHIMESGGNINLIGQFFKR
jgi:hypothetical protein